MSRCFPNVLAATTIAILLSHVTAHEDLELYNSIYLPPPPIVPSSRPTGKAFGRPPTFDFVDLCEVPQLETYGIFDMLREDCHNATMDGTDMPNTIVVGDQTPPSFFSRQQNMPPSTLPESLRQKKDHLWSLLKQNVPHLQTSRLQNLLHANRVAKSNTDMPSNGNKKQIDNANPYLELLIKLLPLTIANVKVLTRITPAVGGYVFGKFPQLLLPLYAAQRIYQFLYLFGRDWYTGRYLRLKFERMQRQYKTQYRIPECLRSVSRFSSHLVSLLIIGRWLEWMLNLKSAPCRILYGGCNIWCGTLWLGAVLGAGHAVGVAIAIWGGPMRIQVDDLQRPSIQNIRRPLRLARWILDPDKWFRDIIARDRFVPSKTLKPFNPDAVLFPSTWSLLKILQMIVAVQQMQGARMTSMMKKILLQQALSDEWYRVLMCEKRVAWAMVVMVLVRSNSNQKGCVTQHVTVARILARYIA